MEFTRKRSQDLQSSGSIIYTNLERVADHCSDISGCVLDTVGHTMNIHQNQRLLRNSREEFGQELQELRVKKRYRSLNLLSKKEEKFYSPNMGMSENRQVQI